MTPAQIEVRDLTVRYGSFFALSGVDFACRPGEFVAIVGRSGTGKSSFLNALAGLIPHSGHVRVDGRVERYEVQPVITDRDYARKFDEVIRAFRFSPARAPDGSVIAGTTRVTFTLPGKRSS